MSRPAFSPLLAAAALALAAIAAPASAADYQIEPGRSVLLVRVWKEGPASVFAHDHVARATKLAGTVRYDPQRPDQSSVAVEVDAGGLVMDEPSFRRRLELPPLKEVNRREIQNTMRGKQQLDVATYPTISFRSQRVVAVGEGKLRITGALSLHGQTREMTVPATVERRGEFLHATATFRFRQSEFGITPYSFGSAVRNQDEVEMQIELVAR